MDVDKKNVHTSTEIIRCKQRTIAFTGLASTRVFLRLLQHTYYARSWQVLPRPAGDAGRYLSQGMHNMARIGILTCSNATQDLGCSSVSCLADFRKRKEAFAQYPQDEKLTLVGIINCPGCPTLTGPNKLLRRIRALTEFRVDSIHFTYCIKSLCPFKENYKKALEEAFPNIKIIIGTHEEHVTPEEYRGRVKKLFCQTQLTMADVIWGND